MRRSLSIFLTYGIAFITLAVIIIIVTFIFSLKGSDINFTVLLNSGLVTFAGALIGVVLSLLGIYLTFRIHTARILASHNEVRQRERIESSYYIGTTRIGMLDHSLYRQNRELKLEELRTDLEKIRTRLEKKQQILTWQMSAAESVKDDPRLAIVVAYQGLETEIQNLVIRLHQTDVLEDSNEEKVDISYDPTMLAENIGSIDADTVLQMRDLRNRIIHGEAIPDEITNDKATSYVREAIRIAREISESEQIGET